jgi:uracil-DNA glycosylase family 4
MVEVDDGTLTTIMDAKQKTADALTAAVSKCTRCDLHLSRIHALPGEGNLDARLFLIAQAPGLKEDREGRMFIGPSGKILDELLDAAGVRREELYMTNLIKCRLPKNRRPKQAEIEACSPFIEKEIALVASAVIVPLGYYASRYALKRFGLSTPEARKGFSALYGRLFPADSTKILPLPHPSALLYNQSFKPKTLDQYRKLRGLMVGRS